ncbi:MAG: ROK family protein, partial [Propionicimonas sp.]
VGVDVVAAFTEALDLPVIVENDANLAAIAEARHAGDEDLVYIKAGTGIGAGVVLDGKLRRGASNSAGEIGHLSLDPNGIVCRCGNRGCLETIASTPAILSALESRMLPEAGIGAVVESALAGDVACVRVLGDAGTAIGMAAATLCTILNPEHIVVGGPITGAGDILLRTLGDAMRRYAVPASGNRARITTSVYGDRASAMGAVMLARETFAPVG